MYHWPRDQYLNIWVGKIDVCGYANFPTDEEHEGVFVEYNCIWGGLLAHEIGHYFSLYHTFDGLQDANGCPYNNNCLADGDKVCDTPPHNIDSCTTMTCSVSGDFQNVRKNYMSYCGASLWSRFTVGQKERVRAALYGDYRWSLVSSPALLPINTALEVGIDSVLNNLSEPICNGNFFPKVKIRNSGTSTITNLKITTYLDNLLLNTTNINANLTNNSFAVYTLNSIDLSSSGTHNLKFVI
ncbi:MAG: hypothetical protein IPM95_12480 [Sphingobacteriales bacterium]|nr:hypothetical protein [Sphingobacteriales bacterium]